MKLGVLIAAALTAVLSATAAQASVVFTGGTTGCLNSSCSSLASGGHKAKAAKDGTLSFNGSMFQNIAPGADVTLGKFTLAPAPFEFFNDPFTLQVSFSSPGSGNTDATADVIGIVTFLAGIVKIDFTPDTFKIGNELYTLTLDDVTLGTLGPFGSSRNLEGTFSMAAAVPEPSTWAMMIAGFVGLGFLAHRRKNRVVLCAA
jgi:hypothetical protein